MRDLFPGHYRPTNDEFAKLWAEAVFVFDTNVLLNLYSYPEDVRNVFFSVLDKLGGRIWIPYQVGLEFHRNRVSRIKQSNQKVEKLLQTIRNTGDQIEAEVKNIELEKRNIGIDNIQDLLTAIKDAHSNLSKAVQIACDKLPPVSLEDSIGERLSQMLKGRVGQPPTDQTALDASIADAQDRFDNQIPPGFADADKGDSYRDREISYPRKYGDLILWRQILEHASKENVGAIVLVTGDKKKDWWLLDDHKTLGPLPALVQEIMLKTPVKLFWMYSADQFLQNAESYLQATEVTPEAIAQVKEVSSQHQKSLNELSEPKLVPLKSIGAESWMGNAVPGDTTFGGVYTTRPASTLADLLVHRTETEVRSAVMKWISERHPSGTIADSSNGFPSYVIEHNGVFTGYEVRLLRSFSPEAIPSQIINAMARGYLEVDESRLSNFSLILILPFEHLDRSNDVNWRKDAASQIHTFLTKYPIESVVVGTIVKGTFLEILSIL